ncbi:hypothetical protein HBH51_246300 [Parastagonospora nodorum]|nr:hypothetical protein HBH51_246300 [Parastagonospora nodorum]
MQQGARYIEQLERHEPNYHRFPIHTRMNLAMDLVITENFALPLVSPPPMIAFTPDDRFHQPPCIESPIDPAGAHTPNRMSRIVLVFASDEGFDSCLEWIERIVLKQGRTHRNAC